MASPYRSDPQWTVCPRCDEVLDEVMTGGMACPRCAGAWLARAVVSEAFHDPKWPQGHAMWWRAELKCPTCKEIMQALEIEGLVIDRCALHGVWFDAGELERLMKGDGLSELRQRVSVTREQIDQVRASYERKKKETVEEELRARVVDLEHARDEVQRLEREVDRLRVLLSDR